MDTVLVTGGCGFVGLPCLEKLARMPGIAVHVTSRSSGPNPVPSAHRHVVDLFNAEQIEALLAAVRPTHLLHLAWITTPGAYWTAPENLHWVEASLHLLRTFVANGGRRAVLTGSCAEYDWSSGVCAEATTPLVPATFYGTCKMCLGQLADAYARGVGLSLAWGRLFFLYGPREHPRRLVPSVIRSLLAGRPAFCTAGAQRRDFMHVDDVADALVAVLTSDLEGPVNIASGNTVAVKDVVRTIAELLSAAERVQLGALPTPPGEPMLLEADPRRLRDEMHWKPTFDLRQGLAQTIDWWAASGQHDLE